MSKFNSITVSCRWGINMFKLICEFKEGMVSLGCKAEKIRIFRNDAIAMIARQKAILRVGIFDEQKDLRNLLLQDLRIQSESITACNPLTLNLGDIALFGKIKKTKDGIDVVDWYQITIRKAS